MPDDFDNQEPTPELPLAPEDDETVTAAGLEPASIPEPEPEIAFKDVSISFGDRAVLEQVSFSVERGQTLCILGRSGVGKSVSLRILMGFLKPDSGSVRVEGQEITDLGEQGMQEIRKRVTMVFQNGALFDSLTVRENVAFPLRERGGLEEDQIQQVVDRLLGLVGAEDVRGPVTSQPFHGPKTRRGHRARIVGPARGGSLR